MKVLLKIILNLILLIIVSYLIYWHFFGSVDYNDSEDLVFIIPQNNYNFDLSQNLHDQNLIKNKKAFKFLLDNFNYDLKPDSGGYYLTKSFNSFEIINKLRNKPDLLWININSCLRKEQIGEILSQTLEWDSNQLNIWNNLYKNTDYFEGVYYPDTYLIPKNENVEDVAKRFINRFNEKFGSLEREFLDQNIKWSTGLKIASLIAREAAGREDMNLISGIIWNRLNAEMRLQIDATMQYTLGKNTDGKWWGVISLAEKQSDSQYNTYKNEGLPPTPICSPNIDYIKAVINPEETNCLFYLHDKNKKIYCSKTYEEHKENINLYLK